MIYLGFDPGLSGGCAAIRENGPTVAIPMPVSGDQIDPRAISEWLYPSICADNVIATVELVGAMPKQGLSSTFKFGKGYGTILGVLGALGVRTELVTPQKWKSVVLAGTAKDKDAAIAWCRRAYPSVNLLATERSRVPHDGIADALAIAEYGKRTYK